jgi:hypothetical protein
MPTKSKKERTLETLLESPDEGIRLKAAITLDRIDARRWRKKRRDEKPVDSDFQRVLALEN